MAEIWYVSNIYYIEDVCDTSEKFLESVQLLKAYASFLLRIRCIFCPILLKFGSATCADFYGRRINSFCNRIESIFLLRLELEKIYDYRG